MFHFGRIEDRKEWRRKRLKMKDNKNEKKEKVLLAQCLIILSTLQNSSTLGTSERILSDDLNPTNQSKHFIIYNKKNNKSNKRKE